MEFGQDQIVVLGSNGCRNTLRCGNQSQVAGAAEGEVRAALQSRQYAIFSWAADNSRDALAQVGLSCFAKARFLIPPDMGEYNHIMTEVTLPFVVFRHLIYY